MRKTANPLRLGRRDTRGSTEIPDHFYIVQLPSLVRSLTWNQVAGTRAFTVVGSNPTCATNFKKIKKQVDKRSNICIINHIAATNQEFSKAILENQRFSS